MDPKGDKSQVLYLFSGQEQGISELGCSGREVGRSLFVGMLSDSHRMLGSNEVLLLVKKNM